MKNIIHIVAIIILFSPFLSYGQNNCTSTADNDWDKTTSWSCDAGVTNYPDGIWNNGKTVTINSNIVLPNITINLTTSNITNITVKAGKKIVFKANAKLLLPSGATITLEAGAIIDGHDNSNDKIIEIGGVGIWGRGAGIPCTDDNLVGPGTMTASSTCDNPLPVTFVDVHSFFNTNFVEIHWTTSQEINNSHFVVQRSFDAIVFEGIGTVQGTNTQSLQSYYFHDVSNKNNAFYRIKQVDIDGQYSFSKLIFMDMVHSTIQIFPNPTDTHEIHFVTSQKTDIELQNELGNIIYIAHFNDAQDITLPMNTGIYFMKVIENNHVAMEKIIVR